MFALAQFYKI